MDCWAKPTEVSNMTYAAIAEMLNVLGILNFGIVTRARCQTVIVRQRSTQFLDLRFERAECAVEHVAVRLACCVFELGESSRA